jgi:hypothetical protein
MAQRLPFKTDPNMSLVMVSLMEKETTQLKTKHYDCKPYNDDLEFIECCKKQLWNDLRPKINCSFAGLENIVPNSAEINYCNELSSAQNTFVQVSNTFADVFSNLSKYSCPVPCSQKGFNYNIKYFHKNSWIESDNSTKSQNSAGVAVSYSSLLVEERSETIIYDLECLLTSLGGNLGLFLGFSCFSTLVGCLKFTFDKMFII